MAAPERPGSSPRAAPGQPPEQPRAAPGQPQSNPRTALKQSQQNPSAAPVQPQGSPQNKGSPRAIPEQPQASPMADPRATQGPAVTIIDDPSNRCQLVSPWCGGRCLGLRQLSASLKKYFSAAWKVSHLPWTMFRKITFRKLPEN